MTAIALVRSAAGRRAAIRGGLLVTAVATLACAGGTPRTGVSAGDGPAASRQAREARPDSPPRIISSRPLQISIQRSGGGMIAAARPDLWYTVRVEADGKPNMSTLVVGGRDGRENRDAIQQWMSTVRFAPARRDGVPVAAEFRSGQR